MFCIIDAMAERYGMLPTEILSKGSTMDLAIFNTASLIKLREQKKGAGEDISSTYAPGELEEIFNKSKGNTDG